MVTVRRKRNDWVAATAVLLAGVLLFLGIVVFLTSQESEWYFSRQATTASEGHVPVVDNYPAVDRAASDNNNVGADRQDQSTDRSFYEIAVQTGTDKVQGTTKFPACRDAGQCKYPERDNLRCKVFGHFYDSTYQRWLGPMSADDADAFQFLEIGFFNGRGFEAYTKFLPRAELHSMEISCLPSGPRNEGKWPWGNFAKKHNWYGQLLEKERLHCGDASSFDFLKSTWTTKMNRPDAPPLKVVIDDGSHEAYHMVTTVFFWLPRVRPGGFVVVEDIEPNGQARRFRTEFLPQIMRDLHYCGGSDGDSLRFPTLHPFLKSIQCEMHICVFERNDASPVEYDETESMPPPHALDSSKFEAPKK